MIEKKQGERLRPFSWNWSHNWK